MGLSKKDSGVKSGLTGKRPIHPVESSKHDYKRQHPKSDVQLVLLRIMRQNLVLIQVFPQIMKARSAKAKGSKFERDLAKMLADRVG